MTIHMENNYFLWLLGKIFNKNYQKFKVSRKTDLIPGKTTALLRE